MAALRRFAVMTYHNSVVMSRMCREGRHALAESDVADAPIVNVIQHRLFTLDNMVLGSRRLHDEIKSNEIKLNVICKGSRDSLLSDVLTKCEVALATKSMSVRRDECLAGRLTCYMNITI